MKEGFSANKTNVRLACQILTKKGFGNLCISITEIHQVSTKYHSKYDIFPILFYYTQHNYSNYKFYSNFTKLDLVKSGKVKVQNTVKTFHESKLQNQQTPVVKPGLAYHCQNNRRTLSDSSQLTISLLNTIGNNKHEFLKSHPCHLRAIITCKCAIKVLYNKSPIVHVFTLSLIQFIKFSLQFSL